MEVFNTFISTVLIIFFLLPGISFLHVFQKSEKGSLSSSNFYYYLMWGTLISTVTYLLVIYIFNCLCFFAVELFCTKDYSVSITQIYYDAMIKENIDPFVDDLLTLLYIVLFSILFSLWIAKQLSSLIMDKGLDLEWDILKFKNPWFYLLTGRSKGNLSRFPRGYFSEIFLLCEIGKSIVIYMGTLESYNLKDESLEYITLRGVFRSGISEWEAINMERINSTKSSIIIPDNGIYTHEFKSEKDILTYINTNPPLYFFGEKMAFSASEIKNIYVRQIGRPLKKPE